MPYKKGGGGYSCFLSSFISITPLALGPSESDCFWHFPTHSIFFFCEVVSVFGRDYFLACSDLLAKGWLQTEATCSSGDTSTGMHFFISEGLQDLVLYLVYEAGTTGAMPPRSLPPLLVLPRGLKRPHYFLECGLACKKKKPLQSFPTLGCYVFFFFTKTNQ